MLKGIPMLDILKLIDNGKSQKWFSTIDKIVALAHVSQSMGNYFARDDALEPALSVVCQGLRGVTDFEHILRVRGGSFQSLASAFYHLKSPEDRDRTTGTRTRAKGSGGENFGETRYCWLFQRAGRCSKRVCGYAHQCATCGGKNHGRNTCWRNSGRN